MKHSSEPITGQARTTLERALAGYDERFYEALCVVIADAIAQASLTIDPQPTIAIRTGETADALVATLVAVVGMMPLASRPTELRKLTEAYAKRIRTGAAAAKDNRALAELLQKPFGVTQ